MNWTSCARINARRGLPPATMGAGGQNPAKNCRRPQSASNPSSVSGIPKRGMSAGRTPLRPHRVFKPDAGRSGDCPPGRNAHVQFLRRGGRYGYADYACHSRRRSHQQYAAPDPYSACAWPDAASICAFTDGADASGAKMSKRAGAMSLLQYRDEGYLPEAVLNYLARLGWSHGDAEIFSREQFV